MIKKHLRRPREPVIDDAIGKPDLVAADIGFDQTGKTKVFAKDGRLSHLAFRP